MSNRSSHSADAFMRDLVVVSVGELEEMAGTTGLTSINEQKLLQPSVASAARRVTGS